MENLHLKHIERDGSETTGRRKILCLFHPEDTKLFQAVSKDILEQSDCSLYYFDPTKPLPEGDAIRELLGSVSAAVLVVSSRFLFDSCHAREVALPLVQENALPILPILTEAGLEETFNIRVGSIQCLCPYAETYDATTVPYTEKLRNYLTRLLATDIDDASLRNAFDASVFLSYRKKDRAMAQKLIRQIHEDPALRGVSIWYDEFLTPGEDFNQSLRSEIEGSDLFILAVTPFMLEGDNYVKITEYPLACSLGKSILPFMMEETDRDRLSGDFPGIAEALGTDDGAAVRAALLGALRSLGIEPIENTAQRQFFKGVAYLKGICVEKNAEIAAAMIGDSAEQGFIPAIERIALMYKNGDGVARNTETAAKWQQKLLDRLLGSFEASPTSDTSELYVAALLEMADIQVNGGNYDAACDFYGEVNLFCASRAVGERLALLETRAGSFELAGKALMSAGRYWDAWQRCFKHALELRVEIFEEDGRPEAALSVIEARCFIATCAEENDSVVAVKEQIVLIKNALAELDGDELFDRNEITFRRYVGACNLLSHLYNYMLPLNAAASWNLWDMAMERVMKNKILINRLIGAYPSKAADLMLLRTLINEGDIHADKKLPNHQQAAFSSYIEARQLFDKIFGEDFNELEAYLILAELDIKAARIFRYMKDFDTPAKIYESSIGYLCEMLELSGVPRLKRTLYEAYTDAAEFFIEIDDGDSAREHLEAAEELVDNKEGYDLESSSFESSPLISFPARAKVLGLLADVARAEWDMDAAIEYLTEKHAVVGAYARIMKRIIDQKAFVASYKELISAHRMAGNFEEARALETRLEQYVARFGL